MNNILLDLGIVQIHWYSVFIFIALLIGGSVALWESKKFSIPEDFMVNLFFYMVPISLIGARLYYVLFNWSYYKFHLSEIVQVWQGGLAIHGAMLFGLLWLIAYSKKYKVNTMVLLDITVAGLLIGQSIGRWGNFFNQEAFGPATTAEFLQKLYIPKFVIDGMLINNTYYHPTFLYESLWTLIGFIVILIIRKSKQVKIGQLTGFYLMWYSFGRFFIEMMRTDSLMFFGLKTAQIVSIALFIIGLLLIIKKGKGSVFENRYIDGDEKLDIKF